MNDALYSEDSACVLQIRAWQVHCVVIPCYMLFPYMLLRLEVVASVAEPATHWLPVGESNPGLPRDSQGYLLLFCMKHIVHMAEWLG